MDYSSSRSDPVRPKSCWCFLSITGFGVVCFLIFLSQDFKYRKLVISKGLNTYLKKPNLYFMSTLTPEGPQKNITELRQLINEYNTDEKIFNVKRYGAIADDTIIVVIIQVGQDIEYFKFLILSLANSKGIQDTLIIFSHYYYDEQINYMVRKIDYCKVLQIFYPFSMNLNPGFVNEAAKAKKRLAAEKKHHWWWTANTVFDKLKCTSDHEGLVVFTDDDLLFMEDSLYMLNYMRRISKSIDQCDFVSIGENARSTYRLQDMSAIEVVPWNAKDFSASLGFDITTWNSIVSHYDIFCNVDEDSWSRSLYYLMLNRRDSKVYRVISTTLPRAYKLSVKSYNYFNNILLSGSVNRLYRIFELHNRIESLFYPSRVEVTTDIMLEDDDSQVYEFPRGGWTDPRDKELCSNTTVQKFRKVLLDMDVAFKDYLL